MLRVDTIWSGAHVVGGGITQLFFNNSTAQAQACVDAVDDFWDDLLPVISNRATSRIADTVVELDAGTGALTGFIPVTSPGDKPGLDATAALAPATQGLIRLVTATVVNGRLVRGRIFLPGMVEANNDADGTPSSGLITGVKAGADVLIADATAAWVVWHRPVAGSGGSVAGIVNSSMWEKWAVLRSRRD